MGGQECAAEPPSGSGMGILGLKKTLSNDRFGTIEHLPRPPSPNLLDARHVPCVPLIIRTTPTRYYSHLSGIVGQECAAEPPSDTGIVSGQKGPLQRLFWTHCALGMPHITKS